MTPNPEPPVIARALLGRVVPASTRQQVMADMAELFAWRARTHGPGSARWWYRRQALRLALALSVGPGLEPRPPGRTVFVGVFMDEIRLASRRLRARPAASIASIVTLACSIGAVTATWSLLSAVLLHPLPVREPDRLMVVGSRSIIKGVPQGPVGTFHLYTTYRALRDLNVFDGLVAGGSWHPMVATNGIVEARPVFFASHDYFATLGLTAAHGRSFLAEDDQRAAPLVAILSDRLWRRAFDADPEAVGRTITVSGQPVAIIGVAPAGFRGLSLTDAPDLFMALETVHRAFPYPMNFYAEPNPRMSPQAWIQIAGRLRDGSNPLETAARLNAAAAALSARPELYSVMDVNAAAIPEASREGMSRFAGLLATTVGLLLLIGCFTVGMLLLVRTEARRDEFAMCLALGATRRRLAGSVALEGALLALAGVALSNPFAMMLFGGVQAFELPGRVSIELLELSIDARALAAAAAAGLAATLLMATVAGAFGFPGNAADALRARAGATPRVTRRRTRTGLVAAQIAVALVLVAGATLFTRSLINALNLNPGIDTGRIVTASVSPGSHGYEPARAAVYFDDLRRSLLNRPSIRALSFSRWIGAMPGQYAVVDGTPLPIGGQIHRTVVDDSFFDTLGLPLSYGRAFDGRDREGAPLVGIASASLARQLAAGGDPIGLQYAETDRRPAVRIIGVVPDVISSVSRLEPLDLYLPLAQHPGQTRLTLMARAETDATLAMADIMTVARALDPAVKPTQLQTMDDQMAAQMSPQRFGGIVMGALGAIAVLLTVLGVYVLAESMAIARQKEMSIRAALGASRSQLGGLVLRETTKLVGVGLAVGLGLAWLGAGTIEAFLFRIDPLDAPTLAGISAALLILALVVSLRPAVSAARADLARVLRDV